MARLAVGIMQGRLVPPDGDVTQQFPRERWREEFPRAREAGLASIEWIYDTHGLGANPVEADAGIAEMRALSAAHGIAVRSICADYFMEHPLVGGGDARSAWLERLTWLLGQAAKLGVRRVVIPFVDGASIRDPRHADEVVSAIETLLPTAERHGVELHLETALDPGGFRALLARLPHRLVRANYDSGNSASLGYDVREEFAAYGTRIGSVHLKDRIRGGGTVPLGEGGADLRRLAESLREARYQGDIVLQVARGRRGEEVAWAQQNRELVEQLWTREALWTSN